MKWSFHLHCGYVFPRKCICGITYQQTRFTNGTGKKVQNRFLKNIKIGFKGLKIVIKTIKMTITEKQLTIKIDSN